MNIFPTLLSVFGGGILPVMEAIKCFKNTGGRDVDSLHSITPVIDLVPGDRRRTGSVFRG